VSKTPSGEPQGHLIGWESRQLLPYVAGRDGRHARDTVAAGGGELPAAEGCVREAGPRFGGLGG